MINGSWDGADPPVYTADAGALVADPSHFKKYKDKEEDNTEGYLDTDGTPSSTVQYLPNVQYYDTYNFLTLGLPIAIV